METKEIIEEATKIVDNLREKKIHNLDGILVLQTALMTLNTWNNHQAIKRMELEGSGGYPN